MRRITAASSLLLLTITVPILADTPNGWRNDGTGVFPSATPPSEWSESKNVVWKIKLPGKSYGAPVIAGDRLFVVSDPSDLLCINRADGKILWQKSLSDIKAPAVRGGYGPGGGGGRPGGGGFRPGGGGMGGRGGMGGMSAGNTAATPVTDGKYVAMVQGNGVAAVYSPTGERLWAKLIESPHIGFGHSSSPVLADGKLIVHIQDLVALELASGKEVWRVSLKASHASPVATKLGDDEVIVSPAGAVVRARDGKVLVKGSSLASQSSPVVVGDTVCVFDEMMQAVKLTRTESGEVKLTSLWKKEGSADRHHLPSPVAHDGLLYGVSTSGYLEVLDLKTGERVYRQRLNLGQVYSSVTLAGDQLYVIDTRGKAVVFKPGRKFDRVATNELEETGSCPVFVGDKLFLRGVKNLYCLGDSTEKKSK
jgi:outer membrane protein assembly factor BamB